MVTINGRFTENDADKMLNGIEIETDTGEKKTAFAETLPIELSNKSSQIQVVLYQGINRQIRKMFAKLGFEVTVLKRIQHATVTLDGLKKGKNITLLTVEKLCNIIGCTPNDIVEFIPEEKK